MYESHSWDSEAASLVGLEARGPSETGVARGSLNGVLVTALLEIDLTRLEVFEVER